MDTNTPPVAPAPKFKRGDIVRLNSGGPEMVVADCHEQNGPVCNCMWFVFMELTNAEFPEACLTLVTPQ